MYDYNGDSRECNGKGDCAASEWNENGSRNGLSARPNYKTHPVDAYQFTYKMDERERFVFQVIAFMIILGVVLFALWRYTDADDTRIVELGEPADSVAEWIDILKEAK